MLNFWQDGSNTGNVYGFLATITYDFIFMAQGIIDTIYRQE